MKFAYNTFKSIFNKNIIMQKIVGQFHKSYFVFLLA